MVPIVSSWWCSSFSFWLFEYTSQVFCLIPFLYKYFHWRFHSVAEGEESPSMRAERHLREVKNPEGRTWFVSVPNVCDFSISSSWDHHLQGSWKRKCLSGTAICLQRVLTRNLSLFPVINNREKSSQKWSQIPGLHSHRCCRGNDNCSSDGNAGKTQHLKPRYRGPAASLPHTSWVQWPSGSPLSWEQEGAR